MAIALIDKSGKRIGSADVPAAFAVEPKGVLLHQAVKRHLANRRAGTASTKTRDEVAGGGKKPWRQKGTGRARHGSIRSPIWRKGGVVFGPHPRSFAIAMPKKARRRALAMALAAKGADGSLTVIDAAGLAPSKTKELTGLIWPEAAPAGSSVLFVIDVGRYDGAAAIAQAGRNLARLRIVNHGQVSVHGVLAHDRVLVTKNAYEALAEVCGA